MCDISLWRRLSQLRAHRGLSPKLEPLNFAVHRSSRFDPGPCVRARRTVWGPAALTFRGRGALTGRSEGRRRAAFKPHRLHTWHGSRKTGRRPILRMRIAPRHLKRSELGLKFLRAPDCVQPMHHFAACGGRRNTARRARQSSVPFFGTQRPIFHNRILGLSIWRRAASPS